MFNSPAYLWGGLSGLVVLLLAIICLRQYARYRRAPAKRWRDQVLKLQAEVHRRLVVERGELRRAGVTDEAERSLRDQAFYTYLTGLSVEELDPYPGIGPATIAKLREAGYTNLALLQSGPIKVFGLKGKRLGDVIHAIRDLVKQARSRFRAGSCREAQELAAAIEKLWAATSEEGFRAGARLRAAEAVMEELEPLAERAHRISFAEYLNPRRVEMPLSPLEQRELPDLDQIIRTADLEAKAGYAARNGQRLESQPAPAASAEVAPRTDPSDLLAAAPAATRGMPAARPSHDLFRDMLAQAADLPMAQRAEAPPFRSAVVETIAPVVRPVNRPPPAEKPKPEPSRQDHLAALEIEASAPLSGDLVRRQYNLLSERYAAEKFTSAGPEFVALAHNKREAIRAAATALLQAFGEKVELAVPAAAQPQELRHNPDLDAVFGD